MHSGQLAGLVCLPVGVLLDDPFRQASSQLLVLQSRLLEVLAMPSSGCFSRPRPQPSGQCECRSRYLPSTDAVSISNLSPFPSSQPQRLTALQYPCGVYLGSNTEKSKIITVPRYRNLFANSSCSQYVPQVYSVDEFVLWRYHDYRYTFS